MNPNFIASLSSTMPTAAAATSTLEQTFLEVAKRVPGMPSARQTPAPEAPPPVGGRARTPFESTTAGGSPPGGGPTGGGTPAAGAAPTGTPDPSDMTLPPDVLTLVVPILNKLRMKLETQTLSSPFRKNVRLHLARNGSFNTYVMHFPWQTLTNAEQAIAVATYGYLFNRGDRVRVLSKDCENPEPAFDQTWDMWTTKQGVETEYVEWRKIVNLAKLDDSDQPVYLQKSMKLPEPKPAPALKDDAARIKQLADLLSNTGLNSGKLVSEWINQRLLVLPTGMRAERSDWGVSFPDAAAVLVPWLINKDKNPQADGYTCLASVLVDMAGSFGGNDREFVIEILEQYQLVTPDEALQAAKKKVQDA